MKKKKTRKKCIQLIHLHVQVDALADGLFDGVCASASVNVLALQRRLVDLIFNLFVFMRLSLFL